MNKVRLTRILGGIALVGASMWSLGAHAQTTSYPISITCTSAGQLCTPVFSVAVSTTGVLQAAYTASPLHCSNVRVHFLVDSVDIAQTPFLTPGQSSAVFNLGPVTPGSHTVGFQAEGTVSGCNTGTLAAWGGTGQVTVSQVSASVPGPGIIATAIAFLLGALAFRKRFFR
jgi:hypothetical protein